MIESRSTGDGDRRLRTPPAPGARQGAVLGRPALPFHTRAELLVRRLRYFVDLLETGYRQALSPAPLPGSLRAARIALGIDWPELDTVPLWSVRRGEAMVAIPFIEFIFHEICRSLEDLWEEVDLDREIRASLNEGSRLLQRVLEAAGIDDVERKPSLPRLEDVFLPLDLLDEILGPGGRLAPIVRRCELALVEPFGGSPH
jgi:hypothetical protein